MANNRQMKYAIIILSGAADDPVSDLEGLTPLQAAETPHLDQVSRSGRQGTVVLCPPPFAAGPAVATMTLLGYDPNMYFDGHAPLEAAGQDVELEPGQWVFRTNFVTIDDNNTLIDPTAGRIETNEAALLLESLAHAMAETQREDMAGLEFLTGERHRHLLVDRSGSDYSGLETTPPHDLIMKKVGRQQPRGGAAGRLMRDIMDLSCEVFADHEVNQTRIEIGESQATQMWIWGHGTHTQMPPFARAYGQRGALIAGTDLPGGLARLIGWDRLDIEGATGDTDTNYAAKGKRAVAALSDHDLVCVHVKAADEASHRGDFQAKIEALEAADEYIVAPLWNALRGSDEETDAWRLLIAVDHYTLVSTRRHGQSAAQTAVPFAMAGKQVSSLVQDVFNETNARESDLHIESGHNLMEYFLRGGLAAKEPKRTT